MKDTKHLKLPGQGRTRTLQRRTVQTLAWLTAMLSVACLLTGCVSPQPRPPVESSARVSMRNNCYSLLHQLLNEEKNVGLLRFIKRQESDVKLLVKRIAANSAAGAALLEEFGRHDSSIHLHDIRLPQGEVAAREAIAITKRKELLGETGDKFELNLLLTQAQALSYGWHLAMVGSANDAQPDRARAVAAVGQDLEGLHLEVIALLFSRMK